MRCGLICLQQPAIPFVFMCYIRMIYCKTNLHLCHNMWYYTHVIRDTRRKMNFSNVSKPIYFPQAVLLKFSNVFTPYISGSLAVLLKFSNVSNPINFHNSSSTSAMCTLDISTILVAFLMSFSNVFITLRYFHNTSCTYELL
jgi:hypothetical protein